MYGTNIHFYIWSLFYHCSFPNNNLMEKIKIIWLTSSHISLTRILTCINMGGEGTMSTNSDVMILEILAVNIPKRSVSFSFVELSSTVVYVLSVITRLNAM